MSVAPIRIQRQRTRGWRMPPNTLYVGRGSRWGNPRRVGMYVGYKAADAVADYRRWIERDPSTWSYDNVYGKPPTVDEIRAALAGKNLACWCALGQPCHADVLLELANAPAF